MTQGKNVSSLTNNPDEAVAAVVDRVQPTLDEELGTGNSSRQTAPEAWGKCPRQLDPLGTLKTGAAHTTTVNQGSEED